jgi:hypothetical protein
VEVVRPPDREQVVEKLRRASGLDSMRWPLRTGSNSGRGSIVAKKKPDDVSIGKFDILATYAYAKALLDGLGDGEAKERGMVAAVMGAKAKGGHGGGTQDDHKADKDAAEKKKKTTITAESFDKQVADKMGGFFKKTFLPTMKKLVKADLSYDEVKKFVQIPATWGRRSPGSNSRRRRLSRSETPRNADPHGPRANST